MSQERITSYQRATKLGSNDLNKVNGSSGMNFNFPQLTYHIDSNGHVSVTTDQNI